MGKSNIERLNDLLFQRLENLNDVNLTGSDLEEEIDRAKAVSMVAEKIIKNNETVIKSLEIQAKYGIKSSGFSPILGLRPGKNDEEIN